MNFKKQENRSPILQLTIHKVGNHSPKHRLPIGNRNNCCRRNLRIGL
ncbi:MAG: hypothetical protein LBU34_14420 [Planctomycetaceae bacterium]|nr:hypothetical protein [Planctomycetaceae bacterium]